MRIKKARSPERIAPSLLPDYIYSMLFIFIYNPRSDSGTLRKRIGWDSELTIGLGNTPAVFMKGNEFASAKFYGESTSLSFIYRIISYSFFPFVFLTSARAYVAYVPREPHNFIFFPSIKFSYRRFQRRLGYFSPHSRNTFNIKCLLLTQRLHNIYFILKLGAYLIKIR